MVQPLDQLSGLVAGRYQIEDPIGSGGMSYVYAATDRKLDRRVAIKVLKPDLAAVVGGDRFTREIEITAHLQHPHILSLLDSGEVDGTLYYVMPLVEGESLRARLDREGQLPLQDAYAITEQVADALSHAHSHGVVHRDIKPENILLSGDHALVADFGIAGAISAAGGQRLTESGIAVGTPQYMSPEQAAADQRVDPRSDLYALGCVLYEMLAGQAPFTGPTAQAIMRRHQFEPPPPLEVVRPQTPRAVVDVVSTALQKAAADRHRTAAEFRDCLAQAVHAPGKEGERINWRAVLARTPLRIRIAAGVAIVAGVFVGIRALLPSPPSWVGGRPESVVIVPFEGQSATDRERAALEDLTAAITRELDAWEQIRVIPQVALAGPMFDLGLPASGIERIEDGARLARAFGVQALVVITARARGDSVRVEADLFDAKTGHAVGRGFVASGLADDPGSVVGPIAAALIGLNTVVDPRSAPRRMSANPEALLQDALGMRDLERWRLAEAERHFRNAVALDSTFALARQRLAQALYWQTAQEPLRLSALGPEIARQSTAALRYSSGLPVRDSLHVRAFHAFQGGDYTTARSLYHSLLDSDSADVYAWLMLGSVEFRDPWLTQDGDAWIPRSNLNTAVHAFSEAVRLQPTFDLGYGHLFDIHRTIMRAAEYGFCPAFDRDRDEEIAPWEKFTPREAAGFCPIPLDSITWVPRNELDTTVQNRPFLGAKQLFEQSVRLLRRWAAYAPDEREPWSRLTAALLDQRSRLGVASPSMLDSITTEARTYAERSLTLSSDTLPIDVLQLANLYLAADSIDRALALVEQGLALHAARGGESGRVPELAANVYLATGQPLRALPLVTAPRFTRYLRDTLSGGLVAYAGAEELVDRLRALGAVQVAGDPLTSTLADLERRWAPPRYTPHEVRLLRGDAALRIAFALIQIPGATANWDRDLGLDEPLWRALVISDTNPSAAGAALRKSVEHPTRAVSDATRAFLHGWLAARLGEYEEALSHFNRFDSLALLVHALDFGWGLRSTALYRRAEVYEALGRGEEARADYERFLEHWTAADSLAGSLRNSAEARLAILRHVQ